MNAAIETTSLYEDFVLDKDIVYFRTGHHGLVSFHGKNFNVKRRLSREQLNKIIAEGTFFKVNTDCYANIKKIETIKDNRIHFDSSNSETKSVAITRLKHYRLKEHLSHQK